MPKAISASVQKATAAKTTTNGGGGGGDDDEIPSCPGLFYNLIFDSKILVRKLRELSDRTKTRSFNSLVQPRVDNGLTRWRTSPPRKQSSKRLKKPPPKPPPPPPSRLKKHNRLYALSLASLHPIYNSPYIEQPPPKTPSSPKLPAEATAGGIAKVKSRRKAAARGCCVPERKTQSDTTTVRLRKSTSRCDGRRKAAPLFEELDGYPDSKLMTAIISHANSLAARRETEPCYAESRKLRKKKPSRRQLKKAPPATSLQLPEVAPVLLVDVKRIAKGANPSLPTLAGKVSRKKSRRDGSGGHAASSTTAKKDEKANSAEEALPPIQAAEEATKERQKRQKRPKWSSEAARVAWELSQEQCGDGGGEEVKAVSRGSWRRRKRLPGITATFVAGVDPGG